MATDERAEAFCRVMMVELEDQWTSARGHQERHPLREKIRQLEWISGQVAQGENLDAILERGQVGDDEPVRCMVCAELLPRWQAVRAGGKR